MRISSRLATGGILSIAATATLSLGMAGVANAMPTNTAPGESHASPTGDCHGVFGNYFGGLNSASKSGQSANAPLGNTNGLSNRAGGGCPSGG